MFINGRYIVSACALLFFQQAMASGMDCTKAANAVEKTKRRIQGLRKHNPEFALERVLDALAYSEDESGFSADLNEDEQPLFESFQSTAPSKRHKKTPADFSARGFPGHRLSQTSATNTSAIRILNAAPVSVGFTQEDDGMTLVPAMNRFGWSWVRQSRSTTESFGLSPMMVVPMMC